MAWAIKPKPFFLSSATASYNVVINRLTAMRFFQGFHSGRNIIKHLVRSGKRSCEAVCYFFFC